MLTEIVEEHLWLTRQHSQWRVVTHRGSRLLTIDSHRCNGVGDILFSVAEHHLFLQQVADGILHMSARLQFLQLDAVGAQPLAVRVFAGELLFDFAVVVNLTLLCVNQQNLSWLQSALFGNLSRLEVHHTHFTCYDNGIVLGDGVACRAQTVAVEHSTCKPSVAEQQGSRTVPGFHQNRVVFVESLQVFRNRVLVVKAFRHQYTHGMRQ